MCYAASSGVFVSCRDRHYVGGKHVYSNWPRMLSKFYEWKKQWRCWICLFIGQLLRCLWLLVPCLEVSGQCCIALTWNNKVHNNIYITLMENLCCNVSLGQDFQRQHVWVMFDYGGPKPEIIIPSASKQTWAVAASNTQCPSTFGTLTEDCRLIAVKPRRYSAPDAE